jgi:hypothetical protein
MFLFQMLLAPVTEAYREKLHRMLEYLAAWMGPEGRIPLVGDDDGGRLFHPYGDRGCFGRATMATAARMLGFSSTAGAADCNEQADWWLPETTAGQTPGWLTGSQQFADAGVAVMRCGDISVYVDSGAFGDKRAGHSHSDTLSVLARAGAEEVLIDPGTYLYVGASGERERFRGTAAHNTVRIDGRDQGIPAGPFEWREKPEVETVSWETGPEEDRLEALCRYAGFIHRRTVVFRKPGRLEITDRVEGPAGEHRIEQFWHAGAAVAELQKERFQIGSRARLQVDDGLVTQIEVGGEIGWWSPAFGAKLEAHVVRGTAVAKLPLTLTTVLEFGDY